MSKLEVEFEFEIGQVVYSKSARNNEFDAPRQLVITERIVQQCPGGIQKHYQLSGVSGWRNEVALSATEPPFKTICTPERIKAITELPEELVKKLRNVWGIANDT